MIFPFFRDIMQEWVDTLRLKLREMKILSPKENLYSKLPEARPPLLPTRDPTRDPLPATPPVPAAIVPGVERIVNTPQTSRIPALPISAAIPSTVNTPSVHAIVNPTTEPEASSSSDGNNRIQNRQNVSPSRNPSIQSENDENSDESFAVESLSTTSPPLSSTSNTLSQNLIKMLYPLPNFSHQTNDSTTGLTNDLESDESFISDSLTLADANNQNSYEKADEHLHSLARTFAANALFDPNISSSSKRTVSNSNTSQSGSASTNNRDSAEGKVFWEHTNNFMTTNCE